MSSKKSKPKKARKPYTITKPRESWSTEEHDRFVQALKLYERDWKQIGAYVKTKTIIQIRSHAQKYFIKMEKQGRLDCIPPPRAKKKSAGSRKTKRARKPSSRSAGKATRSKGSHSGNVDNTKAVYTWVNGPNDAPSAGPKMEWQVVERDHLQRLDQEQLQQAQYHLQAAISAHQAQEAQSHANNDLAAPRAQPEFSKVYAFLGSLFDPSTSGHAEELEKMSQVDRDIVQVLMHNLATNLSNHTQQAQNPAPYAPFGTMPDGSGLQAMPPQPHANDPQVKQEAPNAQPANPPQRPTAQTQGLQQPQPSLPATDSNAMQM